MFNGSRGWLVLTQPVVCGYASCHMKDLPHAGLPQKESTVPGPYGQCRTQVARRDIGENF